MHRARNHLLLLLLPCLAVLSVAPAPASGAAGGRARGAEGPFHAERPCAEDACPVCCAAWQVGLRMVPMRRLPRVRCMPEIDTEVMAPRGLVRPEDLDAMRVAVTCDVPDRMEVVFEAEGRLGDGDRLTYAPEYVDEQTPLPPALRRVLSRPDQCVRVRLEGAGGVLAETSFRVTVPDRGLESWLSGLTAALEARPEVVRRLVRARALLDAGLDLAALREAEGALALSPREPHAAALMQVALARLGLHATELRVTTQHLVWDLLEWDPPAHPADCRAFQTEAPDPAWDQAAPASGC